MYILKKTNGEIFAEIDENVIDNEKLSNIGLIGKLTPNYGETQSENFIHLAENFADTKFPENPIRGMIYYSVYEKAIYFCEDEGQKKWKKIASIQFTKPLNPQSGDMYYDVDLKQFFIFDKTIGDIGDWVLIGPENFLNKRKYSKVITTNGETYETSYEVPEFEANTANLITIKIVGNEKISSKSKNYGVSIPESSGWIYKMLVNSYQLLGGDVVKEVGKPTYEVIGQTDGASNWKVTPSIKDNRLVISVYGKVDDALSSILWEIDVEVLKV